MALSEQNEIDICMALDQPRYALTAQIAWLGNRLTTLVVTTIQTKIALWNAGIGDKFTQLYPVESNKGVKTNPEAARNNIRKEIAVLLERPDWGQSGNYLPRG